MSRDLKISPPNIILDWGNFEDWENGASSAPTEFTLTGTGAAVARESSNVKFGTYSAKVTYGSADAQLYRDCEDLLEIYQGRKFSAGVWIKTSVSSQARIQINDGVGTTSSDYHTGGGDWEFLEVTRDLDESATRLRIYLNVEASGLAYFDGCILCEGDQLFVDLSDGNVEISRISSTNTFSISDFDIARREGRIINDVKLLGKKFNLSGTVIGLNYSSGVLEDTSYSNEGGSGDRTSLIPSVSSTGSTTPNGTLSNIIDGDDSSGAGSSIYFDASEPATNYSIEFDFGTEKLIDEVTLTQTGGTPNQGTWKFQGSNNGSDWTDLGSSFAWDNNSEVVDLSSNALAYRYYRMVGVSGTTNNGNWFTEVDFKLVGVPLGSIARANFDALKKALFTGKKDLYIDDDRVLRGYLDSFKESPERTAGLYDFDLSFRIDDNPVLLKFNKSRTVETISSSPTTFSVTNNGVLLARPIFRFLADQGGDISSLTIENLTNGQVFSYTGTVSSGDILVIDTEQLTVLNDGTDDIANFSNGDFIEILTGDNELKFTGSNCTIKVDFFERFV